MTDFITRRTMICSMAGAEWWASSATALFQPFASGGFKSHSLLR